MLFKVTPWIDCTFDESSKPAKSTVIQWLQNGSLKGYKIGGNWYIDTDLDKAVQKKCTAIDDKPLDFSFLYSEPNAE